MPAHQIQTPAVGSAPARSSNVTGNSSSARQKPGLKSAIVLCVGTIALAAVGAGMLATPAAPAAPLVFALAAGLGIASCIVIGHYFFPQRANTSPLPEDELNRRTADNFIPANLQYPGVEPVDFDFDGN